MSFTFCLIDEASARAFLTWRYEPPYDLYNGNPEGIELELPFFMDPQNGYFCIFEEDNELVAFCCFGQDAQVPGGDYSAPALDLGLGMRPDLTGQGRGLAFVEAVLDFARQTFAPAIFRVTIAEFNRRAQRVWEKAGFRPAQTFQRHHDDLNFVVMIRSAAFPPLERQPNV
jgi:[ribosomal protein S18]-alanine N-acetyltransferase